MIWRPLSIIVRMSIGFLDGMLGRFDRASDRTNQCTLVPWSWSKKDFCFLALNMEKREKITRQETRWMDVDVHSDVIGG